MIDLPQHIEQAIQADYDKWLSSQVSLNYLEGNDMEQLHIGPTPIIIKDEGELGRLWIRLRELHLNLAREGNGDSMYAQDLRFSIDVVKSRINQLEK